MAGPMVRYLGARQTKTAACMCTLRAHQVFQEIHAQAWSLSQKSCEQGTTGKGGKASSELSCKLIEIMK
eukprot:6491084-Amphidinium_carterae.2